MCCCILYELLSAQGYGERPTASQIGLHWKYCKDGTRLELIETGHIWSLAVGLSVPVCWVTQEASGLLSDLQVSSPARRPIPRVDDQSSFGSLYMSPSALGRSRWSGCATDKNNWLRSTKLFSRWSVTWNSLPLEMKTTALTLHSDSSLAGWKLRCFYAVFTRQRNRHNFCYKTAWNINTVSSVTELNWTD